MTKRLRGGLQVFKRVALFAVGLVLALGLPGAAPGQTGVKYPSAETYSQIGYFATKGGGSVASKPVIVPYLFGHNRADADAMTRAAGLKPRFAGPSADNASVINQSVPAGRDAPRGMTLVIRMGLVDSYARAPQLVGLNRASAIARSDASGLKPIFYGPTDVGAVVASQSLPVGQQIARGSYIQLQMRAGMRQVTAPNFVGLSLEDARALASTDHLRPVLSGDTQAGARVTGQSPAAGQEVPLESEIQLQLAVPLVRTPPLIKHTRAYAEARVGKIGLVLDASGDPSNGALVVRQSPPAGAMVPPGSHVQVVLAAPVIPPTAQASSGPTADSPGATTTTTNATETHLDPGGKTTPDPKGKRHSGNGLMMLGGVAAAVLAVAIALAMRPRPVPTPPVTYVASVDGGRPTVRLASEPPFAGRALSLVRSEEEGA